MNEPITQKQLDEAMVKLQEMFNIVFMDSPDAFEKFDIEINHLLGQNYIYYADWDDEWVNDDWTYDLQGYLSNKTNLIITAIGTYEIGMHSDKIRVICYNITNK